MKPLLYHYVLAHGTGISAGIGVIGAWALMLRDFPHDPALLLHLGIAFYLAVAAVAMAGIGWIFGFICIWGMFLGHIAMRLQGWPFAVGDRVWILTGERKNTMATVCEVWRGRGEVRVDLGTEPKKPAEDVYNAWAVCCVRKAEPGGPHEREQELKRSAPRKLGK